jgi:hypothetical protein
MSLIADFLLISGALCAGVYCLILSKRLSRFTDLEKGMGGAVAVLSVQVDDLTKALERSQIAAQRSAKSLYDTTARAEAASARLELMLATMHDLPDEAAKRGRKVNRTRREEEALFNEI